MTDQPESGVAGGSARREYERRKAKDEARVRQTWGQGRIGTIAVALTPERQSTTAWRGGANGEAEVGRALQKAVAAGVRVLHDRRIPGGKANIDHIVIGPGGVWVIDAKRYKDKRPSLRVEGGILRPRVETLLVGGRDQNKLVDGVLGQVERVRAIVGEVPVRGMLCFVDAEWPIVGGEFTTRGVEVLRPKLLVKRVTAPAVAVHDVEATSVAITKALPPAVP